MAIRFPIVPIIDDLNIMLKPDKYGIIIMLMAIKYFFATLFFALHAGNNTSQPKITDNAVTIDHNKCPVRQESQMTQTTIAAKHANVAL